MKKKTHGKQNDLHHRGIVILMVMITLILILIIPKSRIIIRIRIMKQSINK